MANPQKENGFTGIANEILEKLISSCLNGTEIAVALHIIRKTYGYNKKQDEISLSQFLLAIPVSKPTICKALNNLQLVKIIKLVKKGKSLNSSNLWVFNKDFDTWQLVKKTKLVKKKKSTSKENDTQLVKKPLHTKETIQKTITKEIVHFSIDDYNSAKLLKELIQDNLPSFKEPDLDKWAEIINKLHRIDKYTYEQINYIIKWCQNDDFWSGNILSAEKLRKQFIQLIAQAKRTNKSNMTII